MSARAVGVCCVAVALFAPGCSGDDDASATTTVPLATATAAPPATTVAPDPSVATTVAPTSPPTTADPSTSSSSSTDPTTSVAPPPSTGDAAAFDWVTIFTDLRRAEFELPRNPSLEAIDEVCAAVSECRETTTTTLQFLLDNDLRVEGGAPFEIRSIEYQGTTDDVPLAEALGVVLIVRETVVDQGIVNLVTSDGNVEEHVAPDPSLQPGDEISRAVVLGRDTLDSEWRLSVIGGTE